MLQDTGIFNGVYDDEVEGIVADFNNLELTTIVSPFLTTKIYKDHPKEQIIGDPLSVSQTRRMTKTSQEHAMVSYIKKHRRTNHKDYHNCLFACFLSQIEPKKVIQGLTDLSWIEAIQDELLQFRLKKVWRLVDLPKGKHAIGIKWVYKNKKDEIEAIRLFFAYASFMGFIVYQMDVKSAFLYGTIEEEVYVCQPPCFEDSQFPDKVYKVGKALYGLHQASRAWIDAQDVPDEFYGGVHFLLRVAMKTASTLIETNKALLKDEEAEDVEMLEGQPKLGLWCPRDSPFDLEAFSDSDYPRASLDRKSTTGGVMDPKSDA
nr:hypothetical protein [Tanacetum cinerariifolium]